MNKEEHRPQLKSLVWLTGNPSRNDSIPRTYGVSEKQNASETRF